ncbi:MAG: hypothetical protein J6C84_02015 [Lachnospiraceae bacterium]|nr:hypothetical protein [Lachnospiraceae bacterium]
MAGCGVQIRPYPLGAHREGDKVRFSFVSSKEDCGILLYDRKTGRRLRKIAFSADERIGTVYCKYVEGIDPALVTYQYYEGDRIIPDEHAESFPGSPSYGRERALKDMKAGFSNEEFDWEGDARPHIPYEDCICYCAHVRGFTRHASSRVAHRGTFLGMTEKIPYLKETGITTVELQPVYEFLEIPDEEERRKAFLGGMVSEADMDRICPKKLNYWGYKRGFYFAPKAAYAAGEDASWEFKEMVKAFHAAGMEVILQFYFPNDVKVREIPEILCFWVINYHVDGFRLMGEHIPTTMLASDPVLADTKLWCDYFDEDAIYPGGEQPVCRNLACYRDDYRYVMRKYLKGDENMLKDVLFQMRCHPQRTGYIHYMTNYDGMTLMDLVSYDRKHNEANGEDNRDGTPYNYSWNCGEEGGSRKKKVLALRKKQIKNAMSLLLLSQSTPLIFMGDEFGNSQKGNNNPYCQDNAVTWLDWKDLDRNRELYDFWKMLIALRKAHPILHLSRKMMLMDSLSCGYPDLSYHGKNAWRIQTEGCNRNAGIMVCGKYAKKPDGQEDDFFYLAMNMYWEPQELALPDLPRGLKWESVISTEEGAALEGDSVRKIPARSVCLFQSVVDETVGRKDRNTARKRQYENKTVEKQKDGQDLETF